MSDDRPAMDASMAGDHAPGPDPAPLVAWAVGQVAHLGMTVTGPPLSVRRRRWSTTVSLPSDAGTLWAKAGGPGFTHEAALLAVLARHAAPHVVRPLAVDAREGWFVTADAAPTLREAPGTVGIEAIERLVGEVAMLQRAVAHRGIDLRDRGVPDLRPERWPLLLQTMLEVIADEPELRARLANADVRALNLLPTAVDRWAEQLSTGALADGRLRVSVDHGDVHPGNVLVGAGGLRLFDWGDAVLTHPATTLASVPRMVADLSPALRGGHTVPTLVDRMHRAWMVAWGVDPKDPATLAEVRAAARAGFIVRAATWLRVDPGTRVEFSAAFLGELRSLAAGVV